MSLTLRCWEALRCWDVTVLGLVWLGGVFGNDVVHLHLLRQKNTLIVHAKYGALFSAARRPESRSPWLYGVSGILPAAQLSKLLPDPVACLLLLL